MRFRIEYLIETTEQGSVCQARSVRARDLSIVAMQAHAWSAKPREKHGAGGFQIRDLGAEGRIVVIEAFEGPVQRVH